MDKSINEDQYNKDEIINELIDDSELLNLHHHVSDICKYCSHLFIVHAIEHGDRYCRAFPSGIPDEIWEGINNHQEPYTGDKGYQFKLSPEVSPKVEKKLTWVLPQNR